MVQLRASFNCISINFRLGDASSAKNLSVKVEIKEEDKTASDDCVIADYIAKTRRGAVKRRKSSGTAADENAGCESPGSNGKGEISRDRKINSPGSSEKDKASHDSKINSTIYKSKNSHSINDSTLDVDSSNAVMLRAPEVETLTSTDAETLASLTAWWNSYACASVIGEVDHGKGGGERLADTIGGAEVKVVVDSKNHSCLAKTEKLTKNGKKMGRPKKIPTKRGRYPRIKKIVSSSVGREKENCQKKEMKTENLSEIKAVENTGDASHLRFKNSENKAKSKNDSDNDEGDDCGGGKEIVAYPFAITFGSSQAEEEEKERKKKEREEEEKEVIAGIKKGSENSRLRLRLRSKDKAQTELKDENGMRTEFEEEEEEEMEKDDLDQSDDPDYDPEFLVDERLEDSEGDFGESEWDLKNLGLVTEVASKEKEKEETEVVALL